MAGEARTLEHEVRGAQVAKQNLLKRPALNGAGRRKFLSRGHIGRPPEAIKLLEEK
jgi:hypothetical protein